MTKIDDTTRLFVSIDKILKGEELTVVDAKYFINFLGGMSFNVIARDPNQQHEIVEALRLAVQSLHQKTQNG